ncbi:hypothetical protein JCM8097_007952 [Rhodosporidiobolus ruineniae]
MQLPLLSLDPSKPLKHFDRDEMLREAQDCQKKDDEQLEALLADLDQLKQDVLTCLQKTLSRLITQQQKVVGEEVQEVVQKEEQEAILRDVTELFDAFTVSFYRAFRRTTETYTADLNNALSTTKAREEEQELERLRIQKLLDDVHTAFAGFPKF